MSDEEDWPEYTGKLYEKILISEDYILDKFKHDKDNFENIIHMMISKARAEKMDALFFLYDIDQNDLKCARKLVVMLAIRHISGFQFEITPNPKKTWTSIKDINS